jgi:hypothetical protein
MHKFKVGDLVKNKHRGKGVIEITSFTSLFGNKIGVKYFHWNCGHNLGRDSIGHNCFWEHPEDLILIKEASMSKYDELKQRIEDLNDGWNKEADDVLQEILPFINSKIVSIFIPMPSNTPFCQISFRDLKNLPISPEFKYVTQCEKMTAFKQALLWLLDHSEIKKDIVGTEQKVEIEGKVYRAKIIQEA